MPEDEFELLLERCRESLSEITLQVPTIEGSAPPPPVYTLTPEPPPRPKPAVPPPASFEPLALPLPPALSVPREPTPPKPLAPEARPEPDPAPEPPHPVVEETREEPPPPRVRSVTPMPSAPPRLVPQAPAFASPAAVPGRRAAAATAAAAVVTAGAFGVWLTRRAAPDLDIEVAGADALAVRAGKGDLLVAEGKELLDLSMDGRTLERRPLDASVESLRWEQGSLWSADGRTASVIEHDDGGRSTVYTLNHVPGALYVKDKYLWTAEKGGGALHEFLISRSILGALLQPLDSFELSGLSPETFTFDDAGTLWVVDEPTRRIYRLRLENGSYRRNSSAPLSPLVGPQGKLRGLTIDGSALWILALPGSAGHASLRRIALSRLDWTPS